MSAITSSRSEWSFVGLIIVINPKKILHLLFHSAYQLTGHLQVVFSVTDLWFLRFEHTVEFVTLSHVSLSDRAPYIQCHVFTCFYNHIKSSTVLEKFVSFGISHAGYTPFYDSLLIVYLVILLTCA